MNKSFIVGLWNEKDPCDHTVWLYHGISKEKALISFIYQYINKDYSTRNYPDKLEGIYRSHVIKDRILYDLNDDIVIYAQNA